MRFLIIAENEGGKFRDVAKVAELEVAVSFVGALLGTLPSRRGVQLWGTHKGRIAWVVRTHDAPYGQPVRMLSMAECRANAKESRKKWEASRKAEKAANEFWKVNYRLTLDAGFLDQSEAKKAPIYTAVYAAQFAEALEMLQRMKSEREAT